MLGFINNAYQAISRYSGSLVQGSVAAGAGLTLVYLFKNRNLKIYQKVIPISGVAIAGIAAVPAAISLSMDATAAYIPALMAIACIAGVINDATLCWQERNELNNLLRETKSKLQLKKEIQADKSLTRDYQHIILNNVFKPEKIYYLLYKLRRKIINDSEKEYDKNELIAKINLYIEKMSEGIDEIDIDLNPNIFMENEKQILKELTLLLESYNSAKALLRENKIDLPHNVSQSLLAYTNTQNIIYSQFLPEKVKKRIVSLIEGNAITQVDLNVLYANIAVHFRKYHTHQIDYALSDLSPQRDPKEQDYPTPHIKLNDSGNDLFKLIDRVIESDPLLSKVREVRQGIQSESTELVKEIRADVLGAIIGDEEVELRAKRKAKKKALKQEFAQCYEATINMIDKASRLIFLKKSLPRHKLNLLFDMGFAVTSISLSLGMASTPMMETVLYGAGTLFTVLSVGNGVALAIKQSKQTKQLATARTTLEANILKPKIRKANTKKHPSLLSYFPAWKHSQIKKVNPSAPSCLTKVSQDRKIAARA